ncbi:MAG: Rrf2 family transcriptional regulator [Firmicutes bacterium]|nr:Rrf2 family transcriptional regulator [Bacillota bacterium]
MRLTTKGRYGVKALFELALRYGAGPVSLKEIAENQGLSEHYLEQLAGPLRKAGLIASVRGAHGGYVLTRPPEQIRVGDILRALEGPLEEPGAGGGGRDVWCRVTARLVQVLDTLTLGDLVDEVRREQESLMYYI